jgi:hypothetical protein
MEYVWTAATFVVVTYLLSLIPGGWIVAAVLFCIWLAGCIIRSTMRPTRRGARR